jgi:threonine dehydratase
LSKGEFLSEVEKLGCFFRFFNIYFNEVILKIPEISDVRQALERIKNQIHRTPILTSKSINAITGAEIFFKCENLQKVGAFKFRGASNAVLALTDEEAKKGVATHSSGNHAQALALAAALRGIPAYIVMPDNSPEVKKEAVAGYGGNIIYCEPTLQARENTLEKVVNETGSCFIHPYNNFMVISGQGTAAIEIFEDIDNLDIIMTPVGGGGLLSGTSIAAKSIRPEIQVIAGEPKGADDAYQSLKEGKIIPSINPRTIADGLLTSLSELTFSIISKNVDEIITVSEKSIIEAMKFIWTRLKLVVEPSACVTLAAILDNKEKFKDKRIAIILSGGNIDLGKLPF